MKAVGKYIVLSELEEKQKTESGILLTSEDSNQLRYKKGLILIPGIINKYQQQKHITRTLPL